jgi:hypothetical protein
VTQAPTKFHTWNFGVTRFIVPASLLDQPWEVLADFFFSVARRVAKAKGHCESIDLTGEVGWLEIGLADEYLFDENAQQMLPYLHQKLVFARESELMWSDRD